MTEQAQSLSNMQVQDPRESSYVTDPVLAEEMAYAEKPHQEDAVVLGGLIKRGYEAQNNIQQENDAAVGVGGHKGMIDRAIRLQDQNEYILRLGQAEDKSLTLANSAATNAVNQYQMDKSDPAE